VHTVTNWNLAIWRFTDGTFRDWASGWYRWSAYEYQTLSFSLNTALRHLGCIYGQFLGCDSGGWYHLDHIAQILHCYVTEDELASKGWRPNWVIELRSKLAGRRLLEGMTVDAWLIVLLHAMKPESHQPPRYQLVLEKGWDQGNNVFARPYAVRAASGHSSIDILDPERIAATVPQGISSYVSGIFHITEINNLSSIFRHGLHPGGAQKFSRMDVHFMAYFPTDPRNEYLRDKQWRKLHVKRNKTKTSLVVLSIQPQALWKDEVRFCSSNGFLLMNKPLPLKYIEAIYELEYDDVARQWKHQLLYHQLAAKVTWQGCKFGKWASIQTIAHLMRGSSAPNANHS